MARENTKAPWESKTLWFNLLTAVVTIATSASGILPEQYGKYIAIVLAVANLGLRLVTSKGIG